MQHFSEILGIQHLDVPHLSGRTGTSKGTEEAIERRRTRLGKRKRKREPTRLKKSAHPIESKQVATMADPRGPRTRRVMESGTGRDKERELDVRSRGKKSAKQDEPEVELEGEY